MVQSRRIGKEEMQYRQGIKALLNCSKGWANCLSGCNQGVIHERICHKRELYGIFDN